MATISFDYEALRKQLDEEYRIDEYRRKLEALDMVREMAVGTAQSGRRTQTARNGNAPSSVKKAFIALLRNKLPGHFGYREAAEAIEVEYPQFKPVNINSLRAVAGELVQEKRIKVFARGGGQKQTVFQRVTDAEIAAANRQD